MIKSHAFFCFLCGVATIFLLNLLIVSVNGQLTFYLPSDKVSEGPCNNPPPAVATNLNSKWINQPRTYYITYGNKALVRRYAETFLNRPAKSVDELDTMCLQVSFNGKNITTFAYQNQTLEQSCTSKTMGVFNCLIQSASPNVNTTAIKTSLETLVYTDNASVILIVRCVNDQVRDYKLLSTTTTISGKVIMEVKAKVTGLGFSTLYSTKVNCDGKYAIQV